MAQSFMRYPSTCFISGQASQTLESGFCRGDLAVVCFSPKIYWFCSLPEAKATESQSGRNLVH